MTPPVVLRAVQESDYPEWKALYQQYADFYQVPMPPEVLEAVWGWLQDPQHETEGLVAEDAGHLVGLAHFRRMPSPLRGSDIGFLDDLFVTPDARGERLGEALIARLEEIARERGWPKIRWITADDNYRARGLYDRVGQKTSWNLYEITC